MVRSPLYDIYDPYGVLEQQAQLGVLPGDSSGEGRDVSLSDLMPQEEQQGLLRSLANAGASGLGTLGWLLDTPGAVVRGVLSEGPMKGLSALWESSEDRVDGRELLRQYGAVGDEDNWGNFSGGLATELLLDPLTYMSFGLNAILGRGAKTLAGRAAGRAGLLDDFDVYARTLRSADGAPMGVREAMRTQSIADLLNRAPNAQARQQLETLLQQGTPRLRSPEAFQALRGGNFRLVGDEANDAYRLLNSPLAATNRVGLPFMEEGAFDLFGRNAGDFIARTADRFGEGLKTSAITGPAVRGLQAAFDPNVLGMTDYERQWDARRISAAGRQRAAADRQALAALNFDADLALRQNGLSLADQGLSAQIREVAELGDSAIRPEYQQYFQLPQVRAIVDYWQQYRRAARTNAASLGLPLREFESRAGVEFFPRQQMEFDTPRQPDWPAGVQPPERVSRPYSRGNRPVNLSDNFNRGRRQYTDVLEGSRTLNQLSTDANLQASLRAADRDQTMQILQDWETQRFGTPNRLYEWVEEVDPQTGEFVYQVPDLPRDHPMSMAQRRLERARDRAAAAGNQQAQQQAEQSLASLAPQISNEARRLHRLSLYSDLGDFLRGLDPQYAERGQGFFSQNAMNEMGRYVLGRGQVESNAREMLDLLRGNAVRQSAADVGGNVNYSADEALKLLGFDSRTGARALRRALRARNLRNVSFNKSFIDDWARVVDKGRAPPEISPLIQQYDNFTKSFKTLALLWPSRYTRDLYSGKFAAGSIGAYNPLDALAAYNPFTGRGIRTGDYTALARRLASAPGYQQLSAEERVRRFLTDAAGEGLGTSTYADDIAAGGASAKLRESFPGQARPQWRDIARRIYNPNRGWLQAARDFNPFAVRTASGNRNPILELGDRAAESTDAMNRYGSYLTLIRQGHSPREAKRLVDLTQVDYGRATDFENRYLKRLIPFYSYTRGITPYIYDQVVNKPSGLVGQATRIINRAGQPSEDTFIPDYLRQSAAIPLPGEGDLRRFLTNIDLPFESTVNLFTAGTGNTLYDQATDTVRKTALNFAGQMNPLIKGPLEMLTNRQFYSGRELSDLYSTLEQSFGEPGRLIEQVAYNLPGGSRAIGAYRQLTDQRLDPADRYSKFAFNALTGLKFQDVDMERTRRLAARNMLNELLETTPGVRTYENITVPEDVLRAMPKEQQDMYLLYKIIQSEAAKRARDRKKQQAAMDPLQLLGVLNQPLP